MYMYVTAVADLTENGRLDLHVQKNPRKFRDPIILWSDVIDDGDDNDALALMTHFVRLAHTTVHHLLFLSWNFPDALHTAPCVPTMDA